jgi:hypothetical protein
MALPLSRDNLIRVLGQVHPDFSISDDCIQCVLQMVTPMNDLFAGKNKEESTQLIQTYFTPDLGKHAKSEMIKDIMRHPQTQPQYAVIEYLLAEILELAGNTSRDHAVEVEVEQSKRIDAGESEDEVLNNQKDTAERDYRYDASNLESYDPTTVISVYDLYVALVKDAELKQMFTAYLIPKWILSDDTSNNVTHPIVWMNLAKVTELAQLTLPGVTYMDHVLKCIRNILFGQVYIAGTYPRETAIFLRDIPIPPGAEEILPRRDQLRILGLILGGLKYKIETRTVVTFVDLIWAINNNIYYPKFSEYLNLDIGTD